MGTMKIRRENECMGKNILKSERNWAAEVVSTFAWEFWNEIKKNTWKYDYIETILQKP